MKRLVISIHTLSNFWQYPLYEVREAVNYLTLPLYGEQFLLPADAVKVREYLGLPRLNTNLPIYSITT